jgi:hypothetical protein
LDRSLAVERLLRDVPPHDLPAALRSGLGEHFGALAVELLVADYALTELCRVGREPYTTEPIPVEGTTPGAAFVAQAATFDTGGDGVTGYLPVSVRGDRLGVLAVTLPEEHEPSVWAELERFAEAVAHELFVADRDTDLYIQARRSSRLTLAAETQWQLLPGRACTRAEFALGGQLEPAYAIYGDCFDWSASARKLAVTLINGMGEGSEAALLTNLAINALRNARRAGIPLDAQAELADQAVYARTIAAPSTWRRCCWSSTSRPARCRWSTPVPRGCGGCATARPSACSSTSSSRWARSTARSTSPRASRRPRATATCSSATACTTRSARTASTTATASWRKR